MEPGQQEVEPRALVGWLHHARRRHGREGAQQVGAHAGRRLKGEDAAGTQEVDRQSRIDLAGQE